jgi:hypothetical protein
MFVTTDIHEGFKRAGIEVTAPEPAVTNSEPAFDVSPTRPEGSRVTSPGWTSEGNMPAQQRSATEYSRWTNDAQARDADTKQRIADSMPKTSKEPEATKSQSIDDVVKDSERKLSGPEQTKGPALKPDIER